MEEIYAASSYTMYLYIMYYGTISILGETRVVGENAALAPKMWTFFVRRTMSSYTTHVAIMISLHSFSSSTMSRDNN